MTLSLDEESRIIEMAWEDRTPFEAIAHQFNMGETAVIKFMRRNLKPKSFKSVSYTHLTLPTIYSV